jgi:chemotaxis protein methyltransferase CheR
MPFDDKGYFDLKEVIRRKGLDTHFYRDPYIQRRIDIRVKKNNLSSYGDYLVYLEKNPSEFQELVDCLAVNVTSFFRDGTPYHILRETLFPNLVSKSAAEGKRSISVWSSACSTGEEPYSIAISACESIFTKMKDGLKVQIIGSDIDDHALAAAKLGEYSRKEAEVIDDKILKRYFSSEGDRFVVKEILKEMVRFRKLNLISDPPLLNMDLVFCRNMLIYIQMDLQEQIFEKFYRALNPGGYLVIGKTEVLPVSFNKKFSTINLSERIYQKEVL